MRICLAVTNDVVTDQRVHRIAASLAHRGAKVTVTGRFKNSRIKAGETSYTVKLLRLFFNKGPLFLC
ncbi:MAG: hypothetical protein HC906_05965 [Bacteroidales bacterium]|nr:hypothetical protein [Bacteroidales bacterium]